MHNHPHPVRIEISDGASIPDPREKRLINAWSISVTGAVSLLVLLCVFMPDPYVNMLEFIADGIVVTFQVTVMAIGLSIPIGLITGIGRLSRNRALNLLASTYVEIIRGIPLLVQLFFLYYGMGKFFGVGGIPAAVIAMSVCYGAYMGEVFRAGISAIDRGQTEAARSLGFTPRQTLFYVVLPGLAHHSAAGRQRIHRHAQRHVACFHSGRVGHFAARHGIRGRTLQLL